MGTDPEKIIGNARRLLDSEGTHQAIAEISNPYGDGRASERIVAVLDHVLHDAPHPVQFQGSQLRQAVRRWAGMAIQ